MTQSKVYAPLGEHDCSLSLDSTWSCSQCTLPLSPYVGALFASLKDTQNIVNNVAAGFSSSNTPPDDCQTQAYTTRLGEDRRIMSWLDESLNKLDKLTTSLRTARNSLEKRIDRYALALNPIRRIPNDVLLDIFSCCIEEQKSTLHPRLVLTDEGAKAALLVLQKAPWVLSHVSSSWRNVVLSYPQLWSDVFFYYCGSYTKGQMNLLRSQLSYTGAHSLSMTIIATSSFMMPMIKKGHSGSTKYAPSPFFTSIAVLCSRWKTLRLYIPEANYEFLGEMEYMLNTLQYVSINVVSSSNFGTIHPITFPAPGSISSLAVLNTASNLRSVHCHPALLRSFGYHFLNRITHYSVPLISSHPNIGSTLTPSTIIEALKMLPNLEACSIFSQIPENPTIVSPIPFKAPKGLTSVTVTEDPSCRTISPVLELLTIESLQNLAVYSAEAVEHIAQSQILTRSSPPLKTLTLGLAVNDTETDLEVVPTTLVQILSTCPTVCSLTLAASLPLDTLQDILEKAGLRSLSSLTLLSGEMSHEEITEIRVEMKKSYPKLEIHFKPRSFFLLPIPL